jgi:hypothetical protein
MKKVKNKKLQTSITLLIAGALVVVTTPIAKDLIQFLLTHDCPIVGGRGVRECGLAKGLDNADYIIGFVLLWVIIGATLLAMGSIKYFSAKKKS